MALFRWRGNGAGTKAAWQDGRNWVDAAGTGYDQARYPHSVSGVYDDALFDAALEAGASSPSTTVDNSAATETTLNSLRIGADYNGSLATSGAWYKGLVLNVYIEATNAVDVYMLGSAGAGLSNVIVTDGSNINLSGAITAPQFYKGTITLAAAAAVATSMLVSYITSPTTDVALTIVAGATLPSTVDTKGGTVVSHVAVTTLNCGGGEWDQDTGNITTWTIDGGAICTWVSGNITTLNLNNGTLDGSTSGAERRIGNATVRKSGSLNMDNGLANIHVTGYVRNYGGLVSFGNAEGIQQYMSQTYAGASDVKLGLSPQPLAAAAHVHGDIQIMNQYDRLDVYCTVGATDTSTVFQVTEDSQASMATEHAIASGDVTCTLGSTDDNKTKLLQVWGYQLTAAHYWVRVTATATGGTTGDICAVMVLNKFA